MFERQKLQLSVHTRGFADQVSWVEVSLGGRVILRTAEVEPGPDLLASMDRAEKFVRLVQEGVGFEDAYLTAFPS